MDAFFPLRGNSNMLGERLIETRFKVSFKGLILFLYGWPSSCYGSTLSLLTRLFLGVLFVCLFVIILHLAAGGHGIYPVHISSLLPS